MWDAKMNHSPKVKYVVLLYESKALREEDDSMSPAYLLLNTGTSGWLLWTYILKSSWTDEHSLFFPTFCQFCRKKIAIVLYCCPGSLAHPGCSTGASWAKPITLPRASMNSCKDICKDTLRALLCFVWFILTVKYFSENWKQQTISEACGENLKFVLFRIHALCPDLQYHLSKPALNINNRLIQSRGSQS